MSSGTRGVPLLYAFRLASCFRSSSSMRICASKASLNMSSSVMGALTPAPYSTPAWAPWVRAPVSIPPSQHLAEARNRREGSNDEAYLLVPVRLQALLDVDKLD